MKILNSNMFVYSKINLGFMAAGTSVTYTTDISNRFSIGYGNRCIAIVTYHKTHYIELCDTKRDDGVSRYFEILE